MWKAIGFVFLIFFAFVGINLVANMAGSFLPAFPGAISAQADQQSTLVGRPNPPGSAGFIFFGGTSIGNVITQGYGDTPYAYLYIDHFHDGIDIAANYGSAIHSASDGTVLATGDQDDYCPHLAFGKYVAVEDNTNHLVLWYAHLGNILVSPGATITKGTEIGTVGTTGLETGTHLHFSIFAENGFAMEPAHGCGPYPDGKTLNPLSYLGSTYK